MTYKSQIKFQTISISDRSSVSLHLVQVCGKDHILHDEDVIQIVKLTSALAQANPCPDVKIREDNRRRESFRHQCI